MCAAHVRRTCAMNVYTLIHVRRTPVRRTCTAYMYHSVNTLLEVGLSVKRLLAITVKRLLELVVYTGWPRTVRTLSGLVYSEPHAAITSVN